MGHDVTLTVCIYSIVPDPSGVDCTIIVNDIVNSKLREESHNLTSLLPESAKKINAPA